jgi:glycosyltransferase involved in cell wall biosynthesis
MEPSRSLVSVIICFYNEELFLHEAVHSVMQQTYKNWELLLVDDGSSDQSTEFARNLALQNDSQVKYIEHEGHSNKGLSASRNAGILIARGEYIAILDADDVWLPQKLENQLVLFEKYPEASVIFESSLYWYSWADNNAKDIPVAIGAESNELYYAPQLMLQLYPLGKGAAPCPSGILCKREIFYRSKFEESFQGIYQMYEDQAFLCKLYLREKILVSSACNNLYRQRAASLVSSVHDTGRYDIVRNYYLNWFEQFYKSEGFQDERVDRLLKKAFMPYRHPVRFMLTVTLPEKLKSRVARVMVKMGILNYP